MLGVLGFKLLCCPGKVWRRTVPGGQRWDANRMGAKALTSSYTYLLHTSPRKNLSYSQACNVLHPKSPTQQIKFSVKFVLSELQWKERAQQTKSVSPTVLVHTAFVIICSFFTFSLPFPTAIEEKSRQQEKCWELLLLYVHETAI